MVPPPPLTSLSPPAPSPDRRKAPRDSESAGGRSLRTAGSGSPSDRRAHPRYRLPVGYTPILVRTLDSEIFDIDGYAYDISRGGLRFELDRAVAPGTKIAMQLLLPGLQGHAHAHDRAIFVFATVVWIEDEDEPGPVKMAAVFNHFVRLQDQERLMEQLTGSRYQRAAA
ncbi:MAG: PilZ domain-containing protein [Phycisphaerales bacterium]